MLYLFLQVVFASAFMLIIKWTQIREREDVITVGCINYIVASLSVLPVVLSGALVAEEAVATVDGELSPLTGAIISGGSMGLSYFIAYFFAMYAIATVGASRATVVSVLSILFPIGIAAAIWQQQPNLFQWVGIVLALFALILIGVQKQKAGNDQTKTKTVLWSAPLILFIFFLLCGCSRIAQEAFKHVSEAGFRPVFLLAGFAMAALPSLGLLIYKWRVPTAKEFGLGIAMGLSNIIQVQFTLVSLDIFPGYIVFPVCSAGGIVLTTLVATGLMKEKLTVRAVIGIAVSVVALFMLHWLPA
ncbi:MAG: EamA family transporter [Planctomycetota bacterium]